MSKKTNGFTFNENEQLEYEWPVNIVVPGGDIEHKVIVKFYSLEMSVLRELEQRAEDEDEIPSLAMEVVAGWPQDGDKTFRDMDGKVLDVNDENKRKLFDRIYISAAITKAFFASQGGKKRRNSN